MISVLKKGHRQRWLEVSFRGQDIEDIDCTLAMNNIKDNNDIYIKFDRDKFYKHLSCIMHKEAQNKIANYNNSEQDKTLEEVLVKYGLSDELYIALEDKIIALSDNLIKAIEESGNPSLNDILKHFK